MLRGGSPSAYDRILATRFGVRAAQLIAADKYGVSVAMINAKIGENPLSEVAGKTKFVDPQGNYVITARDLGVSFGD